MLAKNSHNSYKKYHPVPNKTRNNHGSAKKSTGVSNHKKTVKTVKTGGRSSTGVIGSAIAAALVPFGLFATQKNVQSKLPSSSYKKKSKRRGHKGKSYKGKSYKGKSYKKSSSRKYKR